MLRSLLSHPWPLTSTAAPPPPPPPAVAAAMTTATLSDDAEVDAHYPPPPLPPRLPSSCDRHPGLQVTGCCASCLRERLAGLQTPQRNSSSASAAPKLRRSQSFSGIRSGATASAAFEPKRRSCDVRVRSSHFHHSRPPAVAADRVVAEEVELRTMKDHIDLESQAKKPPFAAASFWVAASVFSKKLQNWRRKQKLKKSSNNAAAAASVHQLDKTDHKSVQLFREMPSEIALGRRSCSDIAPRFSLDTGRVSVDDPRFSWDAPRASWDGHLIGGRPMFARLPPMLALGEETPAVERWDGCIPVEEEDPALVPGGSVQTRDYYLDSSSSSSRRRRSLDRSDSSVRKQSVEFSELKPVVNASELFHAHNGVKHDRDWKEFSSESFESAFRDSQKGTPKKKSRPWSKAWNIWGLINRRGSGSRGGGEAGNEVDRSFSEAWPELREQVYNGKMFHNNSSARSSLKNNCGFSSMRRSVEIDRHTKKRCGELVLERNQSARYSPGHVDNGMLRFYLTPMRGSRRNGLAGKIKHNTSYPITNTMLGMY